MKISKIVVLLILIVMVLVPIQAIAGNVTLSNLKIVSIGADTVGPNRFVLVSPHQPQCYAVGSSKMLFNNPTTDPNTSIVYSTLLAAMMADKTIEVIHDGTTYCKILRVTIIK